MVALVALMPQAKARTLLFHFGESSGGSRMGRMSRMKGARVNRHWGSAALRNAQADVAKQPLMHQAASHLHALVSEHKACAACKADAVAERFGHGPRVGADARLVEG